MKVCVVSLNIVPYFNGASGRPFGGAEVQANFVAGALATCGHHVSMVVSDLSRPEIIPFPSFNAFDSADGIAGLRFFHPRWMGIMNAFERADADVYFQHCAGMVTGMAALFCRRNGKVFVYGAGSDDDFSARPVGIHGLRDKLLFSYGLNASHGLVVQNDAQLEAARERFKKPARVIPTGIQPIEPITDELGGAIVWIGGMWKVKRPELFLEVARRIPERRFQLVGSGGELAAEIATSAAKLSNFEMLGRLDRRDVDRVLSKAAVLVNTSLVEGFPNAYLEAWNHGVPVVSFRDVDGVIAENDVGAVCGSVDEMTDTIRGLFSDEPRRRAIRGRARALVRERFSPHVLGPRYADFFEQLLATASAASQAPASTPSLDA